jgi:DICT domain-containing protein
VALGLSKEEFLNSTGWELKAYRQEYERLEEITDRRFAMIAMILANANRDSKRKTKPYELKDFMPRKAPKQSDLVERAKSFKQYLRTIYGG